MNKLALFLIYLAILYSCSTESLEKDFVESTTIDSTTVDPSKMEQGHIRIKITEDFSLNMERQANQQGRVTSTNVKSSDELLSSLGIEYMQRVFPPAGKFEPRTRKEGLHLWYDVYFDTSTPLTRAKDDISDIEGITYIEYVPILVPIRSRLKEVIDVIDVKKYQTTTKSEAYFNDPLFTKQWHYYNDGSTAMSIKGSDINVLPVWKNYTSGRSDVIVAIVDGGIDGNHEDLRDNIWVSDTGDHGWNFVNGGPLITPDNHGTHVAGIISAVNNNGKGISGIAGGDYGKRVQGVKLMSCQIFQGEESGSGEAAIKYGADNGAVISQNSWGYEGETATPEVLKVAVDYFIKYAGIDENGNQDGPMKGGIVIFAAGNENTSIGYPAEYEKILAVSAIDASFKRAPYSNYGKWVDIAAPGGANSGNNSILSTFPDNKYAFLEGTSMACPHVSGVAALLISHFGGSRFTNEILWDRLLLPSNDIIYNYDNPFIGNGLLDAYASFSDLRPIPPSKVTDLKYTVVSNNIDLEYTIPNDPDDTKLRNTRIYYSDDPFTKENLPETTLEYEIFSYNIGDKFVCRIPNLEFSTKYYITVDTEDLSGNKSELSDIIEVYIGENNPPEVILSHEDLILNIKNKTHQTNLSQYFYDKDKEDLKYTIISSPQDLFSTEIKDDILTYTFTKIGSSNIKITASDNFGGAVTISFKMLIRDEDQEIDIYPNPVLNILNFRMGEDQEAVVHIYGASGSMLLKKEIMISPFTPAQIDLSSFNTGSYTLVVNYNNKEERRNIVKI